MVNIPLRLLSTSSSNGHLTTYMLIHILQTVYSLFQAHTMVVSLLCNKFFKYLVQTWFKSCTPECTNSLAFFLVMPKKLQPLRVMIIMTHPMMMIIMMMLLLIAFLNKTSNQFYQYWTFHPRSPHKQPLLMIKSPPQKLFVTIDTILRDADLKYQEY